MQRKQSRGARSRGNGSLNSNLKNLMGVLLFVFLLSIPIPIVGAAKTPREKSGCSATTVLLGESCGGVGGAGVQYMKI